MRAIPTKLLLMVLFASVASGCGDLEQQGAAPVRLVINSLGAMPGGEDGGESSSSLLSDAITRVDLAQPCSVFNDVGDVEFSVLLNDVGGVGRPIAPTPLNQITVTVFRIEYVRTDGRNTEGVDVPYAFNSAMTVTVPTGGTATAGFDIVRHIAKLEAPIMALRFSSVIISTIANITFYGQDQAGNPVSATGSIGISFGDFGASC